MGTYAQYELVNKIPPLPDMVALLENYDFDSGFGDDILLYDLVKVLFRKEMVDKLGSYTYSVSTKTVSSTDLKCINIALGTPHTFDDT